MVFVGLILAVFIGIFLLKFGTDIGGTINERLKSPEQRAKEEEIAKTIQQEAERRDKNGAVANSIDFIFGEGKFDQAVGADPASIKKQEQEAIARADAEIELQSQQAGFANRDEAARETDSGSLVVGSSKNVIDFGLIGGAAKITVENQKKKRFGGRTLFGQS